MEDHFVGVTVDLAEEIAKLGTPVWVVSFTEHNPPLTVIPPGAVAKHPILLCILEAEKKNPRAYEDSISVRQEFSFWIQELMDWGQATKPLTWSEPTQHSPSELAGSLCKRVQKF
jgi:hypothetical protein